MLLVENERLMERRRQFELFTTGYFDGRIITEWISFIRSIAYMIFYIM